MRIHFYRLIDKIIGTPLCLFIWLLGRIVPGKKRKISRILFIKLWALGDSVVSLPMIKSLKECLPDVRIDVLARNRNKTVFECCKYVDNVRIFEFNNLFGVFKLLGRYDAVIDGEPYLRLSAIISFFTAPVRIGFHKGIRSLLYTNSTSFSRHRHAVNNYMAMANILTGNDEFNVSGLVPLEIQEGDKKVVNDFLSKNNVNNSIIGICPGAGESARTRLWSKENYAALADALHKRYDAKLLFVGSLKEKVYIENIVGLMKHKTAVIRTYEGLNLRQVFYAIRKCKVFISNDTGPMHIAAAQGVKTIGLFGPNTPVLWRPFGKDNVAIYHKLPCSPCIRNDEGYTPDCLRKTGRYLCMRLINISEVLQAVRKCMQ